MYEKTRFPGVASLGGRRYLVRFKVTHSKTGRKSEHKHVLENCPSAAEASKRRAALQHELAGAATPTERVRLSTCLDTWIANKAPTLAASTLDRYARTLQRHVLCVDADGAPLPGYPLGDHFLDALSHGDIVAWRDAQSGQPSSVNSRLRVLKTALADATVEYLLPRDPASRVEALPEIGADDECPNSLTAEQLAVLLDAVRAHAPRWYALFAVLAFTGARVGEATALKWSDLDVEGELVIRRSHWKGKVRATTKTNRWRRLPLPRELAAILGDHRRALEAAEHTTPARELAHAGALEAGWIFPSLKGTPTLPSSVRNALIGVLEDLELAAAKRASEAGLPVTPPALPRFTVHGLRRTMNNLLRQTVADKTVVKAITGHVTDRMLEHYSTVGGAEKASAVSNVVRLVRRPAEVEALVEVEATRRESGA